MEKKTKKLGTVLNLIALLALCAAVVFIDLTSNSYDMIVKVLQKVCVYAIVAVSMNLLNGFTGLFSLGQAGFMLLGAYTCSLFIIPTEMREMVYQFSGKPILSMELPLLVAILLGGLVAAFFAVLIGLPVLKLKSDYLAIATLGFAEIIRTIIQWDKLGPLTNGSFPLSRLKTFRTVLQGTPLEKLSLVTPYFLFALVCILIIVLVIRSTYGRAFKAIRDDEIAAEAMGIGLAKHKMVSFVLSSFFAGVGGALFAIYQGSVSAAPFTSAMTYEILLIVVIGGIGSITGSVLASLLFVASSEWWLRGLDSGSFLGLELPLFRNGFRLVVFSVIIMIFVLFFRNGIMGTREFSVIGIVDVLKNPRKWVAGLFRDKKTEKREKQSLALQIKKRSIGISILLSIITLGIYGVYWMYSLVKNNRLLQKENPRCIGEMLCLVFVPFYALYWWYTKGERAKQKFGEYNFASTTNGIVLLLFSIFGLNIVSMAIMQSDFNSFDPNFCTEKREVKKSFPQEKQSEGESHQ